MTLFNRTCSDCGAEFQAKRGNAEFCSTACRKEYNNRRAVRGAELYDIVMEMRFNRDAAKDEKLWGLMCSMASAYRDADKRKRAGRQSWDSKAFKKVPMAYGPKGDDR